MKRRLYPAFLLIAILSGLFLFLQTAAAQTSIEAPETRVKLVKLSPLRYPPLARQARITGDVRVEVLIGTDGTVESAKMISGHLLLKQAAIESAQKSQFECRRCDSTESY